MRMQPPFFPNKEEIQRRTRMMAFMKDNGLSPRLQESVMVWDTPSFEMVQEYVTKYPKEKAEELLNEHIHPRVKSKRSRGRPIQQAKEEPLQGEQED